MAVKRILHVKWKWRERDHSHLPVDDPVIGKVSLQSRVIIRHQQTGTLVGDNAHTHVVQDLHVFTGSLGFNGDAPWNTD